MTARHTMDAGAANGVTVQETVDKALSTILRDAIHCIGCGRTDAGVHVSQFYLHFDTDMPVPDDFYSA